MQTLEKDVIEGNKKHPKFKPVSIPPCPWHKHSKLSYLQFFEDADKRDAKGQRQIQCHVCGYWYWPDKFGIDPIAKLLNKNK